MLVQNFDFDANLAIARQCAADMVRNGLYSRFGLSEKERLEKAVLGCMGEYAFEHWLKSLGYTYEVDRAGFENRNADAFDFLIGGCKIDVKVAKKSTDRPPNDNWTYGYPQEQKPASKDYVIVGWVDFSRKEVGYYGWIAGKEISRFPVVTKNTFAGYSYRTPNHEFKWGALHKNFERFFQGVLQSKEA
ncbi:MULTISPECIES: hypothetical protein [Pontibacter]|uniref:Restriction endonuclease n=1 Tax=Pontibacter lucknowensis TaxID=1077936 RepID=A0A1N6YNM6_9BACT|nr:MULTISPECIES: hypothetical protein [Pontibacter]EJF09273.1 hypothetical protein O71_16220 [Pontibacter sp. BAB1700]SIR16049.1 hypothetical protein SAMN05421545_2610 [Pontibacter lucknowensis]